MNQIFTDDALLRIIRKEQDKDLTIAHLAQITGYKEDTLRNRMKNLECARKIKSTVKRVRTYEIRG